MVIRKKISVLIVSYSNEFLWNKPTERISFLFGHTRENKKDYLTKDHFFNIQNIPLHRVHFKMSKGCQFILRKG